MTLNLINLSSYSPRVYSHHYLWPQSLCCTHGTVSSHMAVRGIFWKHKSDLGHTVAHTQRGRQWPSCGLQGPEKTGCGWPLPHPPYYFPFPSVHSTILAVISSCLEQTVLGTYSSFYQKCCFLGPPRGSSLPVFRALLEKALPDI